MVTDLQTCNVPLLSFCLNLHWNFHRKVRGRPNFSNSMLIPMPKLTLLDQHWKSGQCDNRFCKFMIFKSIVSALFPAFCLLILTVACFGLPILLRTDSNLSYGYPIINTNTCTQTHTYTPPPPHTQRRWQHKTCSDACIVHFFSNTLVQHLPPIGSIFGTLKFYGYLDKLEMAKTLWPVGLSWPIVWNHSSDSLFSFLIIIDIIDNTQPNLFVLGFLSCCVQTATWVTVIPS